MPSSGNDDDDQAKTEGVPQLEFELNWQSKAEEAQGKGSTVIVEENGNREAEGRGERQLARRVCSRTISTARSRHVP